MSKNINVNPEDKVLILINTPFQALCAIEAINKYKISNYKLVIAYFDNENRIFQITNILSIYDIPFTFFKLNKSSIVKYTLLSIFRKKEYFFSFLGDYYTILYSFISVISVKRSGKLVYMDDGNSAINIFKDKLSSSKNSFGFKILRLLTRCIAKIKNISTEKYFFSVFYDIPNQKYLVEANTFTNINPLNKDKSILSMSFFIGTYADAFCEENSIAHPCYYTILEEALIKAKEQDYRIVYIPHGKDKDEKVRQICNHMGVKYMPLNVCIELFLIQNNIQPLYVYGFTSSALFTIKKLFPSSQVYNVRVLSSSPSLEYADIAEYYMQHGIDDIVYEI